MLDVAITGTAGMDTSSATDAVDRPQRQWEIGPPQMGAVASGTVGPDGLKHRKPLVERAEGNSSRAAEKAASTNRAIKT